MTSQPTPALYPLITEPRLVHPIWGGRQLAAWLGLPAATPERLGETWQVYDTNPIVNGSLAGHTLAQAAGQFGAALIGQRSLDRYGADFPLLAKFIDAADRLSIQVHPDDDYAHRREADTGFHGKTEAWYILSTTPGASVVYGFRHDTSREEVAAAIQNSTVEALLQRLPVKPGDVLYVPAGTVHAIEAGIVLFEIQQKSDLTYRVYDYDRRDATGQLRALHLDKALDVLDYAPAGRGAVPPLALADGRELLVACPYFALERWALTTEQALSTDPGTFEILTVIAGEASLSWAGGTVPLPRGASVVLPAVLGPYALRPAEAAKGLATLLRVYVPNLERDLLAPLRATGASPERLAQTIAG